MSPPKENAQKTLQLTNNLFEYSIQVSDSILSKTQLYTLTAFISCLYLGYFRNDILTTVNLKLVGFLVHFLIIGWLLIKIFWGVKSESIFVIKALGLQTTEVYHSNFKSSKFIPWHSINDVVINEAIVMQKVIFYLAVLIKVDNNSGDESVIPVFTHARPRLAELKKIYSNIQLILRD